MRSPIPSPPGGPVLAGCRRSTRGFDCPPLPPQLLCVLGPSGLIVAARYKEDGDGPKCLYIYSQTLRVRVVADQPNRAGWMKHGERVKKAASCGAPKKEEGDSSEFIMAGVCCEAIQEGHQSIRPANRSIPHHLIGDRYLLDVLAGWLLLLAGWLLLLKAQKQECSVYTFGHPTPACI